MFSDYDYTASPEAVFFFLYRKRKNIPKGNGGIFGKEADVAREATGKPHSAV